MCSSCVAKMEMANCQIINYFWHALCRFIKQWAQFLSLMVTISWAVRWRRRGVGESWVWTTLEDTFVSSASSFWGRHISYPVVIASASYAYPQSKQTSCSTWLQLNQLAESWNSLLCRPFDCSQCGERVDPKDKEGVSVCVQQWSLTLCLPTNL